MSDMRNQIAVIPTDKSHFHVLQKCVCLLNLPNKNTVIMSRLCHTPRSDLLKENPYLNNKNEPNLLTVYESHHTVNLCYVFFF